LMLMNVKKQEKMKERSESFECSVIDSREMWTVRKRSTF
jgi:hypothetical protein